MANRLWKVLDPQGNEHAVQYVPESVGSYYSPDGFWGNENLPDILKTVMLKNSQVDKIIFNGYEIKEIPNDTKEPIIRRSGHPRI